MPCSAAAGTAEVVVVLMGVSGSGKTTVGRALAAELGWTFLDADDFHPAANVARMAAGVPLTDEDRWPWLDRVVAALHERRARGEHVVLACSALKEAYRARLAAAGDVRFVHLAGDRDVLAARLASRAGHYMPASLLDSQLATLEPPGNAVPVDIRDPVHAQVDAIVRALAPLPA